jgi:flagellar assembly factor FliW
MGIRIDSARFGALELDEEQLLEFPRGLIGIPGRRYALIDPNPDGAFRWLQSAEVAAFALPLVDPFAVLPSFALSVDAADRERIGLEDLSQALVYVTVTAAPDPAQTTANLRAPLVIWKQHGHQVINSAPGADLRAPLLASRDEAAAETPH